MKKLLLTAILAMLTSNVFASAVTRDFAPFNHPHQGVVRVRNHSHMMYR